MELADVKEIIQLLLNVEATCGHKLELFVVDTMARVVSGGDEASSKDMGAVIKAVDMIRDQVKTASLIVHHPGWSDESRGRGFSGVPGAVDTEILIQNHTIKFNLQKDMECGPSIGFKVMPIRIGVDSKGREITSCYVVPSIGTVATSRSVPWRHKFCRPSINTWTMRQKLSLGGSRSIKPLERRTQRQTNLQRQSAGFLS